MNDVSFRVNYDHQVLLPTKLGNIAYPDNPQWNVYNIGPRNSPSYSVRIIFLNTTPLVHLMYLHGHEYWVEAVGTGEWDGKTVVNPSNPVRRDVQLIPVGTDETPGYIVVQWLANNHGVCPFHCHIAWYDELVPSLLLFILHEKLTKSIKLRVRVED
jgi:FtsP/CotA-like multicopper oxidase with cupredoxin domain